MVSDLSLHMMAFSDSDDELASVRQTNPYRPTSAHGLLEYGGDKDGYWMSEKFINNLKSANPNTLQISILSCSYLSTAVPPCICRRHPVQGEHRLA